MWGFFDNQRIIGHILVAISHIMVFIVLVRFEVRIQASGRALLIDTQLSPGPQNTNLYHFSTSNSFTCFSIEFNLFPIAQMADSSFFQL